MDSFYITPQQFGAAENNTGDVLPEAAYSCQDPFTPVHFMSEGGAPWYSEQLEGENND